MHSDVLYLVCTVHKSHWELKVTLYFYSVKIQRASVIRHNDDTFCTKKCRYVYRTWVETVFIFSSPWHGYYLWNENIISVSFPLTSFSLLPFPFSTFFNDVLCLPSLLCIVSPLYLLDRFWILNPNTFSICHVLFLFVFDFRSGKSFIFQVLWLVKIKFRFWYKFKHDPIQIFMNEK